MRRVLLSIVGTIAGLSALLSFKTHTGAAHPLAALGGSVVTPSAAAPPDPTPSGSAAAKAPAASSGPATGTAPASGAPATSTAPATRTVDGQAIQTRYGTVQVEVVLTGSTIKSVSFLQLTADDPRSQDINSQAGPLLLQQTMQAQSANIDGVSGATYTSEGYLQSLQSALDQAGVK